MAKNIKIKLNGVEVLANEGETIFVAASRQRIEIPTLCEHPDFPHKANCRVCVVEVAGRKNLITSCSTVVQEGMDITTNSARVQKARDLNLELIFAEHVEKCATCVWRFECKLLKYARDYKIKINTFKDRKYPRKTYKFTNAVELDGSQCIDCRNCIDACSLQQGINYLQVKGKGHDQEICPTDKQGVECILCGQCAIHCPVSAAQEQYDYQEVEKIIKEGNLRQSGAEKIVVAVFAPSILLSLCEDFQINYGQLTREQLTEGLNRLGFKHVFDLSSGHPLVSELVAREISHADKPVISSDCPAMVRYIEFYKPELVEHLSTVRSSQIIVGGLIKLRWTKTRNYRAQDIIVVSIGPCTARKYEISRSELILPGGIKPVDYCLTTRELSFMLKKNLIAPNNLTGATIDELFAGIKSDHKFYGGSGNSLNKISKIKMSNGALLRTTAALGMAEASHKLNEFMRFDYLEAMSCPGGCFGGGGEPIPTTSNIIRNREQTANKSEGAKMTSSVNDDKLSQLLLEIETEFGGEFFKTKFYKRHKK